jgi:hypothetical protein
VVTFKRTLLYNYKIIEDIWAALHVRVSILIVVALWAIHQDTHQCSMGETTFLTTTCSADEADLVSGRRHGASK